MNSEQILEQIISWPKTAKLGLIGGMSSVFLLLGYLTDIKPQLSLLKQAQQQEERLRTLFDEKYHSTNLKAHQKQMKKLQADFNQLLLRLPEKVELSELIEEVSQQALGSGLKLRAIRLQIEQQKDFYCELPMEISVTGSYTQLGEFVSRLAALLRIVTLHDFIIRPLEKGDNLLMDVTIKSYRYTPIDVKK